MRILLILLAVTITACSSGEIPDTQTPAVVPSVTVQTIQPGLKRSFTITAEVEAGKSASIGADQKADVIQLPVRIGQPVQMGQLLVVLGSDSVNTRLTNANSTYGTANANLEQTRITSQTSVASAQVALETAQKNLASLLQENAAKRQQAQQAYDSAVLNNDLSVASAETNVANALQGTRNTISNALAAASVIFEYNDEVADLDNIKENHIGVFDPTRTRNYKQFLQGLENRNQLAPSDYDNALELLQTAERTFAEGINILELSITSADYSQTQLNTDIATISNRLTTIQNAIAQLRSAKAGVDSAQQQVGSTNQINLSAQSQLDSTIAQINSSEVQAKQAVEQAQNALSAAKAQAEATVIGAKSTVNSAANELRNVQTAANELRINAPFDGRVANITVTAGSEVTAGQTIITIENTDTLKIIAQVAPEEVRQLQIGDAVLLNGEIPSRITSIAPSADPITKKYRIEIDTNGTDLQAGEFIPVRFESTIEANTNEMYVPISSVHIQTNETYVWKIIPSDTGAIATKQIVEIGDLQGKYIRIINGVFNGDTIVIDGGRSLVGTDVPVTIR